MLLIVLPKQLTKQETNTKAESYLYPFQHAWSEDVHASIDFVGDVLWRLFHKSLNLAILRMVDHNTTTTTTTSRQRSACPQPRSPSLRSLSSCLTLPWHPHSTGLPPGSLHTPLGFSPGSLHTPLGLTPGSLRTPLGLTPGSLHTPLGSLQDPFTLH